MSDNVTTLIGQVGESNAEIWDSTTFFAFWYVVSDYVSEDLLNAARNQTYFTNDTELQRLIRPSRPKGVFRSNKFEQEGLPIFQALVDEREEKLIADKPVHLHNGTHSKPKTEQLIGRNISLPEQLVGVVPNVTEPLKIVGEKINITKPEVAHLVSSFNVSEPLKLVDDDSVSEKLVSAFNVSQPQHLVGAQKHNISKPVKPKTEQLVGDDDSNPEKLVSDKFNSSKPIKPKTEQLVGAFNVSEPQHLIGNLSMLPEKLSAAPATTVITDDVPQKLVVDEKEIFPRKLVSAFAPVDEDKKIVRPPLKIIAGDEDFRRPFNPDVVN
jgi:hypothetical protein